MTVSERRRRLSKLIAWGGRLSDLTQRERAAARVLEDNALDYV